ncbi:prenyltransferase/squalene oxidase repeat-containing protein [Bremerella cremea]|uniref:prenyltransferase/squalene oxidase repeat-containing protein n=1 Tax=Bremerella cremea TaxID=1031537 RepID=UPI0031F13BBA
MSQLLVNPIRYFMAACLVASLLITPAIVRAADSSDYDKAVEKGVTFLANQGQAEDGTFSGNTGIGVTAICTLGMLEHGRTTLDPSIKKALAAMEKHVKPDGGIYVEGTRHRNYETCLCMLAFSAANKDGQYDKLLANGQKFLKGLQWDQEEGKSEDDPYFGGAGYGGHSRPDMSNTTFLMEALKASGASEDDPAIQKALIFVSRCQNLESPHNQFEFAPKNPDGGFYYTIAAGGNSQAGPTDNGGLRSYGSMTYAGLKSMIYAGVDKDDQRVKAAVAWLGKNYDTKQNPGMGDTGLYYYYQTVAKALDAYGDDTFVGEDGTKHDWRKEFTEELISRQQSNGSWVNEKAERWMEGDPNLVTGYSLLALSYLKKDDK